MNPFANIFRREAEPDKPATGTKSADVRGSVTFANGETTSMRVSAYCAALNIRANTMAQLQPQYQIRTKSGRNYIQADMFPDGRMQNFLLQVQPNPWMNRTTLLRRMELRRCQRGHAYIYAQRGASGLPTAYWLCNSATYLEGQRYTITYETSPNHQATATVDMRDILHFQTVDGLPLIVHAARALNIAATQDQQTLDGAARGGKRSLVISEEKQQNLGLGKVSNKEMEKLANRLEEEWSDKMIHYVSNAADIHDFSLSPAELELLSNRKMSVQEIARFTQVPAPLIGDTSNSNYKTPEAATLEFLSRLIGTQINELEEEWNGKLLTPDDFGTVRYHFCEKPLFRLDRDAQTKYDEARLRMGVVSQNELRAEYEMSYTGEQGDVFYVSANLCEVGSEKLRSGSTGTTTEPNNKKGGEE